MASIDALRSFGNNVEQVTSIAPDPIIQTTRPGVQRQIAADLLVQSLAKFSSGVGTLYEETKKRTIEKQKREAALLATLEQDLPDGYYNEGVQEYDATRGQMQGDSIASILEVAEPSLVSRIEQEGGDAATKVLRYSSLLDGIVESKTNEVTDASPEYKVSMVQAIQKARTKLEGNYIKQVNEQFLNEQKTTLRAVISNTVANRQSLIIQETDINERGDNTEAEPEGASTNPLKRREAIIQLSDYNQFIRKGLRTTKFSVSQLRGIWLERITEIALSGVDSVGEPVPEVLNHIYSADRSGYKLVFDAEFGGAAEKAQIQANKAYVTFHSNEDKLAAKQLKTAQNRAASTLMSDMIKSFTDQKDNDFESKNFLQKIGELAASEGIRFEQNTTLLNAYNGFSGKGWMGDGGQTFEKLIVDINTMSPSLTIEDINAEFNDRKITPKEYADLTTKFNSFYRAASKPYASAISQQRKNLKKLLQDPEIIPIPGNKEVNLARTIPAYNELTRFMSDTTQMLSEQMNFGSPEFLQKWNDLVNAKVQELGNDEKYRPQLPPPPKDSEKPKRRRGWLDGLKNWIFSGDDS